MENKALILIYVTILGSFALGWLFGYSIGTKRKPRASFWRMYNIMMLMEKNEPYVFIERRQHERNCRSAFKEEMEKRRNWKTIALFPNKKRGYGHS